jgi:hypothetical protein
VQRQRLRLRGSPIFKSILITRTAFSFGGCRLAGEFFLIFTA